MQIHIDIFLQPDICYEEQPERRARKEDSVIRGQEPLWPVCEVVHSVEREQAEKIKEQ